jgi:hypothetical protein
LFTKVYNILVAHKKVHELEASAAAAEANLPINTIAGHVATNVT